MLHCSLICFVIEIMRMRAHLFSERFPHLTFYLLFSRTIFQMNIWRIFLDMRRLKIFHPYLPFIWSSMFALFHFLVFQTTIDCTTVQSRHSHGMLIFSHPPLALSLIFDSNTYQCILTDDWMIKPCIKYVYIHSQEKCLSRSETCSANRQT